MSHFCIIVTGYDVESQLENYCEDTEYIDKDYLEFDVEVEKGEETRYILDRIKKIKDEIKDGKLNNNPIFLETLQKELKVLEESEEGNFGKYFEEWCGYEEHNGNWGYWSNPNAFYDWYQIGGRWSGYFKLKKGRKGDYGELSWTNKEEDRRKDYCDSCLKGDVDVEGMLKDQEKKSAELYDRVYKIVGNFDDWKSFDQFENKDDYHAQRVQKLLNKEGLYLDPLQFKVSREEYIKNNRMNSLIPYGYFHEGEYISHGDMGWWGISNNEKDNWDNEFMDWWNSLPDDTSVTIVDCHI